MKDRAMASSCAESLANLVPLSRKKPNTYTHREKGKERERERCACVGKINIQIMPSLDVL